MSNRLEKTHEDMIKDSAELVAKKGQEITGRMYELLFSKYPQVEKMFKDAPQGQKKILSDALALFAVNIDMLDVLKPALEKIAHSHVRTKVKPGHYPMIGQVLIQAMEEVLGEELRKINII